MGLERGAVDGSENRYPDMVDEGRLGECSRTRHAAVPTCGEVKWGRDLEKGAIDGWRQVGVRPEVDAGAWS